MQEGILYRPRGTRLGSARTYHELVVGLFVVFLGGEGFTVFILGSPSIFFLVCVYLSVCVS